MGNIVKSDGRSEGRSDVGKNTGVNGMKRWLPRALAVLAAFGVAACGMQPGTENNPSGNGGTVESPAIESPSTGTGTP